ncbi:MAG: L-threonylcarbamoyladenylate synthase [Pyrinomonadaceae bacterium]
MKTVITKSPLEAAEFIKRGGIVAFPTETVYGLGASVFDEATIGRIFEAKRRPADNPLIAHIAVEQQIDLLAAEITEPARKFVAAFFPGPLTVVLKRSGKVPRNATAGLDTIGIRMPRLAIAQQFLAACGSPVVAPSANLSGRPSPTTWQAVTEDLGGRIDCILQGDATEIGLESTVVDCTTDMPLVLRSGSVSIEQLREIVPITAAFAHDTIGAPRSPGVRHRHYSPRARVILINFKSEISDLKFTADTNRTAYIGVKKQNKHFETERICKTVDDYAHSVFEFFRECDRSGVNAIYCEEVEEMGIGIALMDRLRRAAAD